MNYICKKNNIEILEIIKNIEKQIILNNYEKSFFLFLNYLSNLNNYDRDEVILYFKKIFNQKYSNIE